MGNLPIVKDLVVDMEPFWTSSGVGPWLQPGYDEPEDGKEYRVTPERMNVVHKEALCINCGCCVSECNSMESDPEFLGPQALAKGFRFVGDPRDAADGRAARGATTREHGIWDCTRCYFCNERCPKGVDPRDAIAKLGAESMKDGIDRDMGAKHAKWFVDLGEDDRLAARDRARPEDAGHRLGDQADEVRDRPRAGTARCRRRSRRTSRRTSRRRARSTTSSQEQGRHGAAGIVQGERALARLEHGEHAGAHDPYGEGSFPRPYLPGEDKGQVPAAPTRARARYQADATPGESRRRSPEAGLMPRVAYYKGCLASLSAKELDTSTQALAPQLGLELVSSSRSPAAAPATSTRPSRTTTCT